jgi:hypothetical protein
LFFFFFKFNFFNFFWESTLRDLNLIIDRFSDRVLQLFLKNKIIC